MPSLLNPISQAETKDPQYTVRAVKQSTTGTLILKAVTKLQVKRQNSVSSDSSGLSSAGRDVESHESTPEAAAGEPEVKRRKAAQPRKVKQTASHKVDLSLPAGKVTISDTETEASSALSWSSRADTDSSATTRKKDSAAAPGNGSAMLVHGFNHEFELDVEVEATVRNVIRQIQPSLNFDLSKAAISLRGEYELPLDTQLRCFVREGAQGMVKVKLVVVCQPNEKLRLTITDILQAAPVVRREATLAVVAPLMPVRVSGRNNSSRKSKRSRSTADQTSLDENDWITSESFALLRKSLRFPLDPVEWDQSHVSHWLAWATKSFPLPELNVAMFSQLIGNSLCSLSREMFTVLVGKDKDDLFWTHFQILRTNQRAAVPRGAVAAESVPSPKLPIKRMSRTTGSKKPLSMSEGWKNRDDLFSSENAGTIQLWQFLLETLAAGRERQAIGWSGEPGEFVLIEPERVAELWGKRKNKDNMNYEKMSRALRYYYGGDILAKVPGKHYTYKFVCDLTAAGYTGTTTCGSPGASPAGSSSPLLTGLSSSSQPSSPSVRDSVGDSDGSSIDVPVGPRRTSSKVAHSAGSLANALESIRRRHGTSASQVAA